MRRDSRLFGILCAQTSARRRYCLCRLLHRIFPGVGKAWRQYCLECDIPLVVLDAGNEAALVIILALAKNVFDCVNFGGTLSSALPLALEGNECQRVKASQLSKAHRAIED